MDNKVEHWVSSKEIAEHLGINKDTLHRWIKNKSIPCHRVGRLWKFKIRVLQYIRFIMSRN